MKKLFIIVGIFSGITSQQTFNIPFDWAGQNGMVINNGKLFWNQTWTSGMLLFDGSYTSFPIKYGGHTSEKFSQNKLNFKFRFFAIYKKSFYSINSKFLK